MKTIVTTCGSFLTGSAIADAVSAYGLELARERALDVVDIPFVAVDGSVRRAQLRAGWLVETVVTYDEQRADELIDRDTTLVLRAKTRSLTVPAGPALVPAGGRGGRDLDWDEII
jgi:hypothetical protein